MNTHVIFIIYIILHVLFILCSILPKFTYDNRISEIICKTLKVY